MMADIAIGCSSPQRRQNSSVNFVVNCVFPERYSKRGKMLSSPSPKAHRIETGSAWKLSTFSAPRAFSWCRSGQF